MVKYITGKFGRPATKQIAKFMREKRVREGKLPNISAREEKQIIERTAKVFTRNGRAPYRIKERDFEKEILNPLRIRKDDRLDTGEVNQIESVFGLTDHTKQVGRKYFDIIKKEKRDEFNKLNTEKIKEQPDKSNIISNRKKVFDTKKFHEELFGRVASIREKREIHKTFEPQINQKNDKVKTAKYETFSKDMQKINPGTPKAGSEKANKKSAPGNSPKEVRLVKGFKPRQGSMFSPPREISYVAPAPKRDFTGYDFQENPAQNKGLNSRMVDKNLKIKDKPEIPPWKIAAYEADESGSSEQSIAPDSDGIQNNSPDSDIDK